MLQVLTLLDLSLILSMLIWMLLALPRASKISPPENPRKVVAYAVLAFIPCGFAAFTIAQPAFGLATTPMWLPTLDLGLLLASFVTAGIGYTKVTGITRRALVKMYIRTLVLTVAMWAAIIYAMLDGPTWPVLVIGVMTLLALAAIVLRRYRQFLRQQGPV